METSPSTAVIQIALEEWKDGVWRDASGSPSAPPSSQAGDTARFRLVARLCDDAVTLFVGSPFTMPRSSLAALADDVEVDLDARVRLGELDSALTTAGWRYVPERGRNWWSLRYSRA